MKVYPPNTTLIANIQCGELKIKSDLAKLVVEQNKGYIWFGGMMDSYYADELVVMDNQNYLNIASEIPHIDVQKLSGGSFIYKGFRNEYFDVKEISQGAVLDVKTQVENFWIGKNCGKSVKVSKGSVEENWEYMDATCTSEVNYETVY